MKKQKTTFQKIFAGFSLVIIIGLSITTSSCRKIGFENEQTLDGGGDGGSGGSGVTIPPRATSISTNDDNRRALLNYYAPVIFKQSNENDPGHLGYDWMTNFFFDGEKNLSNNKDSWENGLQTYIAKTANSSWQIRPTVYTSIIQYYDKGLKKNCATLLYHVYHAKQNGSIHDWERIEIRVNGIASDGRPGNGEVVQYVVITKHETHTARSNPHGDLNFMKTANGNHVMIWQSDWDFDATSAGWAELHFCEETWATINSKKINNAKAEVNVNGTSDDKEFHYIFVCGDDAEAVSYWNAQKLTQANASTLTSGKGEGTTINYNSVKRIQYELQDQADIFPTHLSSNDWKNSMTIAITSPVLSESGVQEIASGTKTFYYTALDDQDASESRGGYPTKHWFWGTYHYDRAGSSTEKILGAYPWKQHEYFVHNGKVATGIRPPLVDESTVGFVLGRGDYANWLTEGGYDGRWKQLFND